MVCGVYDNHNSSQLSSWTVSCHTNVPSCSSEFGVCVTGAWMVCKAAVNLRDKAAGVILVGLGSAGGTSLIDLIDCVTCLTQYTYRHNVAEHSGYATLYDNICYLRNTARHMANGSTSSSRRIRWKWGGILNTHVVMVMCVYSGCKYWISSIYMVYGMRRCLIGICVDVGVMVIYTYVSV